MLSNKKSEIDFVALAVHKLKTPLSSIKLSLEMLLEGDFGELSPEQKKIIERIRQRNSISIDLVNKLINLAKVYGEETYKLSDVDFEGLIQSVVDCEREEIQKKGIKLKVESPKKKLPKLKIDEEKFFWAIQNILDNAVKYSNVGGEVVFSYQIQGKNLELKIKDNGIGIRDSEKRSLFHQFFRGQDAMEADSTGSGLGLFISKRVIEWHKGKISFESKEGKGTTFFITLPLK